MQITKNLFKPILRQCSNSIAPSKPFQEVWKWNICVRWVNNHFTFLTNLSKKSPTYHLLINPLYFIFGGNINAASPFKLYKELKARFLEGKFNLTKEMKQWRTVWKDIWKWRNLNPFLDSIPILYPQKTSENLFWLFSGGIKWEPLATNGLIKAIQTRT